MSNSIKIINILGIYLLFFFQMPDTRSQQVYMEGSEELVNRLRLNKTISGMEKVTYADIAGDAFLYKDFAPGKIVLGSGEIFQLKMRYDIYSGKIQFKDRDQVFELMNPDKIASITIDTLKFEFAGINKSEASDESSFFILGADGKCKLLIKKNVRLQPAEAPKAYQEARPAKFIHTGDTYYLKLEDRGAVKVNNKKDILIVLADKKDELDKFISSHKLGTKSEEDLVKIISFYNKL